MSQHRVCTVPDVDACALSPLVVEFEKFFAGSGAPPDKEIGSDAAGLHPASPVVSVGCYYTGESRQGMGSDVGCLFRRVPEQVLRGRGLGDENIIDDGRGSRCSGRCAWRAEVLLLARLRVVGRCHGGGMGAGRALKGGAFK